MLWKKNIYFDRKRLVGINLARLIRESKDVRTLARFAELHGSHERTVKRWCAEGVDSLATISEIARTLGVPDRQLILSENEFAMLQKH